MKLTIIRKVLLYITLPLALVTLAAQNRNTGDSYRISPQLLENEKHGGRGNWIDLQPGLYSIIDQVMVDKYPEALGYCEVHTDTTFHYCLPPIFNFSIIDDKLMQVDTLRYNWANDSIYSAKIFFNYRPMNITIKAALLWSSIDCIFLANETLNKEKDCMTSYIEPHEIVHINLNNISGSDSIVFNLIKQWDFISMNSYATRYSKYKNKFNGSISNYFFRVIIKNGKPTNAQAKPFLPTLNQIDWVKFENNQIRLIFPWEVPDSFNVLKNYEYIHYNQ